MARFFTRLTAACAKMPEGPLKVITLSTIRWRRTTRGVKSRVFFARARGFESRLEHATYVNAIPIEIFNNLLTTAKAGSELLQRYLKLRKEALGVERLEIWTCTRQLCRQRWQTSALRTPSSWLRTPTSLGQEYIDVYWKGFEEGWVDAIHRQARRGLQLGHLYFETLPVDEL